LAKLFHPSQFTAASGGRGPIEPYQSPSAALQRTIKLKKSASTTNNNAAMKQPQRQSLLKKIKSTDELNLISSADVLKKTTQKTRLKTSKFILARSPTPLN